VTAAVWHLGTRQQAKSVCRAWGLRSIGGGHAGWQRAPLVAIGGVPGIQ